MFMFELPRIKHVGWIAFHKVSLARFKGVGSEKYLKFVLISKRVSSKCSCMETSLSGANYVLGDSHWEDPVERYVAMT